jgi:D-threo-aldose 1-dehydrogenase
MLKTLETATLPHSRRDFLGLAIQGSAVAAAATMPGISAAAQTKGQTSMQTATSEQRYKPPVHFGLGGVPLGNEFAVITEKGAYATLEAAWSAGVRYYDTSPWYGLGLCERRFGNFLHTKTRSDYVLSSKVGKLLKASRQNNAKEYFPFTPSPNNLVFDYTADDVKRSIEDSLQRLGLDALDIVFVHDLSPDNTVAMGGAIRDCAQGRLPCSHADARGRDHQGLGPRREQAGTDHEAAGRRRPRCLPARFAIFADRPPERAPPRFPGGARQGRFIRGGSSLNAGFISGSQRYNYGKENYKIPQPTIEKRENLREVAGRHGVDLRTAALQFSATPDVAAALVVGAASEQQIVADYSSMQVKIPAEFWAELKERKLIEQDAPVPA